MGVVAIDVIDAVVIAGGGTGGNARTGGVEGGAITADGGVTNIGGVASLTAAGGATGAATAHRVPHWVQKLRPLWLV